jgi:hypothetical protein
MLILPPFHTALTYAFVFAIAACLVAAVASLLHGGEFHWEEPVHAFVTSPDSVPIDEAA